MSKEDTKKDIPILSQMSRHEMDKVLSENLQKNSLVSNQLNQKIFSGGKQRQ